MKVKLLTQVNEIAKDVVIECDELTGKEMIESKKGIEVSEAEIEALKAKDVELEKAIETEVKDEVNKNKTINIKIVKKDTQNMSTKEIMEKVRNDEPLYIGKAFQRLAGKAVTGMSEGTAGDGGNLVGTAVADVMGIALQGSQVYAKCNKIVMPPKMNAIKVPVDASDPWIKANVPVVVNAAEGGDDTATKLAFGAQTLTLAKTNLYIPVTDELLQDASMVDQFVRQYMVSKLAGVLDYEILTGGSGGYDGITGNSGYTSTSSISATPTVAELYAVVNKIDPRLHAGSEWFIANALWATIVGALGTSNNINNQLIDIGGKKLFGFPVSVMACLNDDLVFGNLAKGYTVAEPAINDVIKVSEDVRFYNDEVVFKLIHRGAGDVTWTARTAADSGVIGAFCEKA